MAIRVLDIWEEALKIVGHGGPNETEEDRKFVYRRITDAVEILANKGDWDPLLGTLDIIVQGRIVTLPPEVQTILGCNMCGHPSVARDEFFQFHLNGPGSCGWGWWGGSPFGPEIRFEWMDLNDACAYRDIPCPDALMAICEAPSDANSEFWVYGFDQDDHVIRTQDSSGCWRDGYQVPVMPSVSATDPNAPKFSRISGIRKAITAGPVRLYTVGQIMLGIYEPNVRVPAFRKIQLSRCVPWVRIRFRRRVFSITSKYDLLPIDSAQAVLMMLRALKAYDDPNGMAAGEGFEATAVRWMTERQFVANPPVAAPIQVLNSAPLLDTWNYME